MAGDGASGTKRPVRGGGTGRVSTPPHLPSASLFLMSPGEFSVPQGTLQILGELRVGSSILEPSLLLMPGLEGQGTHRLLSLSIPWSCLEAYALHPPLSLMLVTMMLVRDVPRSDFYSCACLFFCVLDLSVPLEQALC